MYIRAFRATKHFLRIFNIGFGILMTLANPAGADPSRSDVDEPFSGPTIVTDQTDYAPGTLAAISGEGFLAGETVTVQVLHADGTPANGADHEPWTVLADEQGQFATTWHVCEDDCVGSLLEVTAKGETSGLVAQATFTDDVPGCFRVGYYDMSLGAGSSSQVAPILTASQRPVQLLDLRAADLAGIDVLFVQNPSNFGYGAEYLSRLADIQAAVSAGMILLIHDRFVGSAETILPGGAGFDIRRDFSDPSNINVRDSDTVVTAGPGGTINNATLDGGNFSSHGFAVAGTLPADAKLILTTGNPDSIVTFSYSFGAGFVIFSSIPLDFYLFGSTPFRTIYAPNVVAYGASLRALAGGIPPADCQPPVITCPPNISRNTDPGQCSPVVVTYPQPTASDNSGSATVTCTPPSGSTFPLGTRTVTCTATDPSGNSASCSFTVRVVENVPPTISCPADIIVGNDPTLCSARVFYSPTAADNCSGVSVSCSPPSGSIFLKGSRTVTCTATDSFGNRSQCTFAVTVEDREGPRLVCSDIFTSADFGQCTTVVTYSPSVVDNCDGPVGALILIPRGAEWKYLDNGSDQGTTWRDPTFDGMTWASGPAQLGYGDGDEATRVEDNPTPGYNAADVNRFITTYFRHTFNVSDAAGLTGLRLRALRDDGVVVYLNGTEVYRNNLPSGPISYTTLAFGASDDGTLFLESEVSPILLVEGENVLAAEIHQAAPNSSDISFDFELISLRPQAVACDPPSGSLFSIGTIPVTCTATSPSGDPLSCSFMVTVTDSTPPTLNCSDLIVPNDPGVCEAVVNYPSVTAQDDCSGVTVFCNPPSGSVFPPGSSYVFCSAYDGFGNFNQCSFIVTITDVTPPTINCPGDITLGNEPGLCSKVAEYSVTAEDDSDCGVTVSCFPPSGSFFDVGSWTVFCDAYDGFGNWSQCSFTVTVKDLEPPQVLPPFPGRILYIEAEDFNYSDTEGINPGQFADFGAEHTLAGRAATMGIDVFDYTDGDDSGGCCGTYRPDAHVEASKGFGGGDQDRTPRNGRDVTTDWVIGWVSTGEWCNYTRTFPEGDYTVSIRWGSGGFGQPMNAELSEVIGDPTQPDQTVQRIGTFHNPTDTGGWDNSFIFSPLQDDFGQPLTVHLSGRKTLRLTVGPGAMDWNYLLFVEAGPPVTSCQDIVVSAAPGQCAQAADWIITDNCGLPEQPLPPGTFAVGLARVADDGTGNGVLHLTDDGQFFDDGLFFISDPAQGQNLNEITVRWRSVVGGATSGILQFGRLGADGYSFNWSPDALGFFPGRAEEGVSFGLSVTIDTWDNNENFEGEDSPAPGINIKYDGQVLASDNLADLGDQGAAKDFLRKNQFVDAELVVTADGQVTFTYDGRVLTAQLPGWFGMAFANFSFGGSVGGATDNHWIDDLSITSPGVDYRLNFDVTPPCNPPSGSSFAVGVNPVTCTPTDNAGNTLNCSFNVIVLGNICGRKFYDANLNGIDDNEPGLAGWKIVITHESSAEVTVYTDETGHYCADVLPGVQTITEEAPDANWVNTTPSSVQVTVSAENCRPVVNFGNVCLGAGGGLTLGYWSNNNGQNSMTTDPDGGGMKANLSFLSSLNLRNPSGKSFDPGTYTSFKGWLQLADSVNAAYMLSVQLAAMQLNVRLGGPRDAIFDAGGELAGGVNGNALIYAPGTASANPQGFATVYAVMAEANRELGLHGVTDSKSPFRTYQQALKDALDNANNNLSFPQAAPCAFTSPY